MKKSSSFILIAVLLLLSCSAVAFAADGTGGIFGGLGDIARFIKRLFVPDENYFHNKLAQLTIHVNDRLGGLAYLYLMINDFFKTLNSVPSVGLQLNIPDNHFFVGYKGMYLDFLTSSKPYINMIRNVLTPSFCLFTAIVCYHKLRTFFKE